MTDWIRPLAKVRRQIWMIKVWRLSKRGIYVGFLCAILLLCIARIIPMLHVVQWAIMVAVSGGLFGLCIGLWRRPTWTEVVRLTDHQLQLSDRLITSWEMREQDHPVVLLQKNDALSHLQSKLTTRPNVFPLKPGKWHEAVLIGSLVSTFILLSWLPNPLTEVAQKQVTAKIIIKQQQQQIQAQEQKVSINQQLDQPTKAALKKELDDLQKQLHQSISMEQAIEEITKSEEKLAELSKNQRQTSALHEQLLKQLQQNAKISPLATLLSESVDQQAIKQQSDQIYDQLTEQEKQQIADQLKKHPQKKLKEAAQKLKQQSPDAKKLWSEAMLSAHETIQHEQQNQASINQSEQVVQNSKTQLKEHLPHSPKSTQTAKNPNNPKQTNPTTQQSKQSTANQKSQQHNKQNTQQQNGQDQQNELTEIKQTTPSNGGNKQAGNEPGSHHRIYVPHSKIESSGKKEVVGGPIQEGSEAQSQQLTKERGTTVPYEEVYTTYQQELRMAIERGELSPEWQTIVRDYFSSIEPKE